MTCLIARKWRIFLDNERIGDIADMGVAKAVKGFDPAKGKFLSFLYWQLLEGCRLAVRAGVKTQGIEFVSDTAEDSMEMEDDIHIRDVLLKWVNSLNSQNRKIAVSIIKGQTVSEAAREVGMSVTWMIRKRREVLEKLRDLI